VEVRGALGSAADNHISKSQTLVTVGVTAAAWLINSQFILLRPVLWLATFIHEAMHATAAMLLGKAVSSVTINHHGGGLTYSPSPRSTVATIVIGSAGYVGAALVGAAALELCKRLRNARVACLAVAGLLVITGLLWVPWNFHPKGYEAMITGSSSTDGHFTTIFWISAAAFFVILAVQPLRVVRRSVLLVVATTLCFLSIESLKVALDWVARGGDTDARTVAAVTPLSAWLWSAIWLVFGAAVCVLAVWSLVAERHPKAVQGPSSVATQLQ
jgi:hypothetical protein